MKKEVDSIRLSRDISWAAAMEMMKFDAFISYSRKDKTIADAICATLENGHVRCWMAPRDIVTGEVWAEAIVQAIDRCRVLVLVYTENANLSVQIRNEVARAAHKGVALVPFRVDSIEPSDSLAYFMTGVHWLDAMTPPVEQHLARLVIDVRILLKMDAPERPAAGSAPAPKPALEHVSWRVAASSAMAVWPTLAMVSAALLIDGLSTVLYLMIGMAAYGISPADVGTLLYGAGQVAVGLGTIRRQEWARFAGLAVCFVGIFMYISLLVTRQDIFGHLGNTTRTFEQVTMVLVLVLGMVFYAFSWERDVLDRFSSRIDVDGSIKRAAKQACFVLMVGVVGAFTLIHFFSSASLRPAYWWIAIPLVGGVIGLMTYSYNIFQQHGLNAKKLLA